MPLSEHEQRLLSQMEQQLLAEDPKFASAMRGSARRGGSARRLLLGGLGIVAGLLLLVVGVMSDLIVVGILAFVLMLASAVYAISSPRRKGPQGVVGPAGGVAPRGGAVGSRAAKAPRGGSFMDRVEERWQRRRSGDGR